MVTPLDPWRSPSLTLSLSGEDPEDSPWSGPRPVEELALPRSGARTSPSQALAVLLACLVAWLWWRPPPGPMPCEGHLECGRPLDVNRATTEELELLAGIGPATSARIVQARPFQTQDELLRVRGIGPATLDRLRPWLDIVGEPPPPPPPRRVDPNTASLEELDTLPRVGPVLAARIVAARPFDSPADLLRVKGIGPATLAAMEPCLELSAEVTP